MAAPWIVSDELHIPYDVQGLSLRREHPTVFLFVLQSEGIVSRTQRMALRRRFQSKLHMTLWHA
jgi:hypothetical protein